MSEVVSAIIGGQAQKQAAKTASNAQIKTANIAASASAFRPVGISTRFGTSQFQMGTDKYGNPIVTGAGYTLSPEMKALQDRLSAMYGDSLGQAEAAKGYAGTLSGGAERLFSLGQQYLATSPEEARQQYIQSQQALLDPLRQQEEARLATSVFGRGRAGLSVGAQGQPELATLANARRMQDLRLAADAEQAAQQRIQFGQGLFGQGARLLGTGYQLQTSALSPFMAQLGLTQQIENLGLQPLEIGTALGGRNINTTGAAALLSGGLKAAQTNLTAQQEGIAAGQLALQDFLKKMGFGQTQAPAPISDMSVYPSSIPADFGGTVDMPWYG